MLVVLFNGCLGQGRLPFRQGYECQLDRISALEPTNRIQSEAGLTEVWDSNDEQFQCSGVSVVRRVIEPNGLLLPSFTSAPELVYIESGRGITGLMVPGCPETYESLGRGSPREEEMRGERGLRGSHQDLHQKIRQFRRGDIIALPAGVAHWTYNNGDEPIVAVILLDTSNHANQLDQDFPRRFYLAGNPQQEHGHHQYRTGEMRRGERGKGNIFSGFDTRILAESFGVSEELARRLQSQQDERGNIVRVQEGLHVVRPPWRAGEEREFHHHGRYMDNGLEETICSARIRENIDDPERADIYTPQAGRLTTLNSFNLPILKFLRLSAEKGVLYRNSIMAPHYNLNAHSIVYCCQGRGRIQIVNERGNSVFNDELRQGQLLVVPQNFAVVKEAAEEAFEWIAFKTNENAMFQTLAGRTSAIRAMPVEVIANIYQISHEQAQRLKYNRPETTLFSSRSAETRRRPAIAAAAE